MHRFASHASSGCAVLILMFGLTLPMFAQSAADDDLVKRGQGLILDTEDDLANVPHARNTAHFYPIGLICLIGSQHHVIKVNRTLVSAGPLDTLAHTTLTRLRPTI
jgi:hypothetical protein